MPSAEEILENLQEIVREGRVLSPVLRLIFAGLLALFVAKRRILAAYLAAYAALALLAVAVMSVVFENAHNPFICVLVFPLGLLWGREALTLPPNPPNRSLRFGLASLFALAALFYPHFVDGPAGVIAFAPLGIVPCPTLILANAALVATGRTFGLLSAIPTWLLGGFFGLVGVFYLGVSADWILVAAVPVSMAAYFIAKRPAQHGRRRMKRRK